MWDLENAFEDTDYPTTFLELQHVEEEIRNEMITHLGQESMLRLLPKRGWYTGSLDDRTLSRSKFFHHFHKRTEHTLFPRPHFQRQNVKYYDCHIKGSKGMHWYWHILADTNYKTLCIDIVNGGFPVFILRENKITFKTSSCLYIGNKDSRLLNIFQFWFRQRGTRAITDKTK